MDPATVALWLGIITQVVTLMIQAGSNIVDMIPYVNMFFQIASGTPLSPEQEANLNAKHDQLRAAALAPLAPPPEDAT